MKKTFILLFSCLCLAISYAQEEHGKALIQASNVQLSVADWQSDLKFLQEKVHKDYSFLFKKITAAEWDSEVEKLYKEIPKLQDHQRMAGIARLISMFKYGHTSISWRESAIRYHIVPVNFYWFRDGIFIEGTDKKYEQLLGAKLIKVEGKPVEEALKAIYPLVPAENEQYFKGYGLDFLTIPQALHSQGITKELKRSVTFTLEKNGKTYDHTLEAVDGFRFPRHYGFIGPKSEWVSVRDASVTPLYLKNFDKIYFYEYLPASKTLYVRHSQVQDDPSEAIPEFFKKVFDFIEKNEVERMVLDVRLNGGGNNYKNKPIVTGVISSKINKPGKFFVITGRRTFSACQNLVNELHNYTNAIFVGEPTAENINFYGDTRRVDLPKSKIPVMLSFAWWQDKPQWENDDWLAPQVAVDMSFEEYKTNKDPVLDACLSFRDNDIVLDPMRHLQDLFIAGKMDELRTTAISMVNDPRYRYVKFEQQINERGYYLLNSKQVDQAIAVFTLNMQMYPKSANTWDSLAEAYLNANKTDKAIEYYNKAIELDPNGATGDNARRMLSEIRSKKGF